VLLLGGAADTGEDAEFAEDDDFEIGALIVAGDIRFGAAVVALDEESGVALVLEAGGVPQDHLKFFGIIVDGDDIGFPGAANAEITENCFLAGERFFLGDGVPRFALGYEGFGNALPHFGRQGNGGLTVEPVFFELSGLGELCGEEFLRRALGFVRGHEFRGLRKGIADTPS